jgi:hypothetical protein
MPGSNGFYDSFFLAPATSKVLRFYPNPATTIVNFEFDKTVESTSVIAIYSFYGKKNERAAYIESKSKLYFRRSLHAWLVCFSAPRPSRQAY